MKHCKNCGNGLKDLYCSHCGQQAKVERITFAYIGTETFHFFSHMDRGFLFTSYSLLIRPGKMIKEFIDGKRKRYQSPVSYFLIWTTIFILFLYFLEMYFGESRVIDYKDYFGPHATTKMAISHLSLVLTAIIPLLALYLFLFIAKATFNYAESMVAAIYYLGTIILLQMVFALGALFLHLYGASAVDLHYSDAFKVLYLIWFTISIVKIFPVKYKFLRAAAFIILSFGTFTLWRIFVYPEVARFFLEKA